MRRRGAAALWLALAAGTARAADPSASAPELYTAEDKGPSNGSPLSLHKLNYAVRGGDGVKLQYSFKLRVVDGFRFYLAYTNYMLWRVSRESVPVKDNVFNPEVFYRLKEDKEWFATLDAGYFHLSNGREGPDSQSIDQLFARIQMSGMWGNRPWHVTSQVFPAVLDKDEFTKDYPRYIGWWDATLWVRNLLGQKRSGLDLQLQRASGATGNPFRRGNNVVGAQYRLVRWEKVNPIFYVQWFTGYGEFLIDYDRYVNKVRGGISWFY